MNTSVFIELRYSRKVKVWWAWILLVFNMLAVPLFLFHCIHGPLSHLLDKSDSSKSEMTHCPPAGLRTVLARPAVVEWISGSREGKLHEAAVKGIVGTHGNGPT